MSVKDASRIQGFWEKFSKLKQGLVGSASSSPSLPRLFGPSSSLSGGLEALAGHRLLAGQTRRPPSRWTKLLQREEGSKALPRWPPSRPRPKPWRRASSRASSSTTTSTTSPPRRPDPRVPGSGQVPLSVTLERPTAFAPSVPKQVELSEARQPRLLARILRRRRVRQGRDAQLADGMNADLIKPVDIFFAKLGPTSSLSGHAQGRLQDRDPRPHSLARLSA